MTRLKKCLAFAAILLLLTTGFVVGRFLAVERFLSFDAPLCRNKEMPVGEGGVASYQDILRYYGEWRKSRLGDIAFYLATDIFRRIYKETEADCRRLDMENTECILGDTFGSPEFRDALIERLEEGDDLCAETARETVRFAEIELDMCCERDARSRLAKILDFELLLESQRMRTDIVEIQAGKNGNFGSSRETMLDALRLFESWEYPYLVRFHQAVLKEWRSFQEEQLSNAESGNVLRYQRSGGACRRHTVIDSGMSQILYWKYYVPLSDTLLFKTPVPRNFKVPMSTTTNWFAKDGVKYCGNIVVNPDSDAWRIYLSNITNYYSESFNTSKWVCATSLIAGDIEEYCIFDCVYYPRFVKKVDYINCVREATAYVNSNYPAASIPYDAVINLSELMEEF